MDTTPDKSSYKVIQALTREGSQNLLKVLSQLKLNDGVNSLKDKTDVNKYLKNNKEASMPITSEDFFKVLPLKEIRDYTAFSRLKFKPFYSVMEEGGYFKPHLDDVFNGHFSHTLFLSDPDTYEGGELELLVNGKVEQFKPEPGTLIMYETGLPHQVKQVTKGVRRVVIWWSVSLIRDKQDFYQWRSYNKYATTDYPINKDDIPLTLKEFTSKKPILYKQLADDILRRYLIN